MTSSPDDHGLYLSMFLLMEMKNKIAANPKIAKVIKRIFSITVILSTFGGLT
jgi:hypothetical protein